MAGKDKIKRNKGGRPSKISNIDLNQIKFLATKGFTDKEFAEFFAITERTWNNWKKKNDEFFQSLKDFKQDANRKVERSLFERATGFSHPDVHISNFQGIITETEITKYYPPDTAAAFIWLKNRDPKRWRDRQEIEHKFRKSEVEKEFDELLDD